MRPLHAFSTKGAMSESIPLWLRLPDALLSGQSIEALDQSGKWVAGQIVRARGMPKMMVGIAVFDHRASFVLHPFFFI